MEKFSISRSIHTNGDYREWKKIKNAIEATNEKKKSKRLFKH